MVSDTIYGITSNDMILYMEYDTIHGISSLYSTDTIYSITSIEAPYDTIYSNSTIYGNATIYGTDTIYGIRYYIYGTGRLAKHRK